MTNNPFEKIIAESLENINKSAKIKSNLKKTLDQASQALNKSIAGSVNIELTMHVEQGKLSGSTSLMTIMLASPLIKDENRGFLFISNDIKAELIASWAIIESTDEISITMNKIQKSYAADDEGITGAIVDVLSHKEVIEKAIELKKSYTTF